MLVLNNAGMYFSPEGCIQIFGTNFSSLSIRVLRQIDGRCQFMVQNSKLLTSLTPIDCIGQANAFWNQTPQEDKVNIEHCYPFSATEGLYNSLLILNPGEQAVFWFSPAPAGSCLSLRHSRYHSRCQPRCRKSARLPYDVDCFGWCSEWVAYYSSCQLESMPLEGESPSGVASQNDGKYGT